MKPGYEMEREEYLAAVKAMKSKKRNDAYNRKRAMIEQIVRYTAQGWTQTMIGERLHLSQKAVSVLMRTPTYVTAYRRFSERMDQQVIDSLTDIPAEAELALQRIIKRASGVPVVVRKEIVVVDGEERETIIEEAASAQVRQRDDHFLTELHLPKKRQMVGGSGNPYLVDPKTAQAIQNMADTMRSLQEMRERQAVSPEMREITGGER
jgi:hypothetical protein